MGFLGWEIERSDPFNNVGLAIPSIEDWHFRIHMLHDLH